MNRLGHGLNLPFVCWARGDPFPITTFLCVHDLYKHTSVLLRPVVEGKGVGISEGKCYFIVFLFSHIKATFREETHSVINTLWSTFIALFTVDSCHSKFVLTPVEDCDAM